MPSNLKVGLEVRTEKFGSGIITRLQGDFASVALDSAMIEVMIPISELDSGLGATKEEDFQPIAEPRETNGGPPADSTGTEDPKQAELRMAVEALRFGIVPARSLEALTVGYKPLKQWILEALSPSRSGLPAFAEVEGPFGTGKSHTMAAVRHVAKEGGFLTARVDVDGRGVTLSDPAGLLMHILRSVQLPDHDSATPLLDLNLKALRREPDRALEALLPFDRIWSNYKTIASLDEARALDNWGEALEAVLCGSNEQTASNLKTQILDDLRSRGVSPWSGGCYIHPKRLVGTRRWERGRDFIESLLGYATLAELAGYTGLVVTMDEFEVELVSLSYAKRQGLADLVTELGDYLCGEDATKLAPLSVFIATTAEDGSGDRIVERLRLKTDGAFHGLKPLSRRDHNTLADRIDRLYREAYGLSGLRDPGVMTAVEASLVNSDIEASGKIRAFIKRYVCEMDSLSGPPLQ